MENVNDILSRKEAAKFLGVCLTTLDRLDIPRTKIRHRVMFKRSLLLKWIDEQTEKTKRGGEAMNKSKIELIVAQLLANAADLRYGSVSVSLKLHDGRVVEVAYSTVENNKEKIKAQFDNE